VARFGVAGGELMPDAGGSLARPRRLPPRVPVPLNVRQVFTASTFRVLPVWAALRLTLYSPEWSGTKDVDVWASYTVAQGPDDVVATLTGDVEVRPVTEG
jgi:hypothetical protein